MKMHHLMIPNRDSLYVASPTSMLATDIGSVGDKIEIANLMVSNSVCKSEIQTLKFFIIKIIS